MSSEFFALFSDLASVSGSTDSSGLISVGGFGLSSASFEVFSNSSRASAAASAEVLN